MGQDEDAEMEEVKGELEIEAQLFKSCIDSPPWNIEIDL